MRKKRLVINRPKRSCWTLGLGFHYFYFNPEGQEGKGAHYLTFDIVCITVTIQVHDRQTAVK